MELKIAPRAGHAVFALQATRFQVRRLLGKILPRTPKLHSGDYSRSAKEPQTRLRTVGKTTKCLP